MQFTSGEWADVPSVNVGVKTDVMTKKLSVVLPFIQSEIPLVLKLLEHSIDLSGQIQRNLFLVPFKGLRIDEVMAVAQKAFSSVGVIQDSEGVTSDWQEGLPMRSAAGPNSLFRQAAWFFYLQKRYLAWLWMEPDCMPVKERWIYELESEYYEVGRPFLGVKMRIGDGREYMNGVGIYPWNAVQHAPLLVQSAQWKQHPEMEVGFDVAGGADVLFKAHLTRKIQLELKKRADFAIRPETALLHGSDNLLGMNGTQGEPAATNMAVHGQCSVLETHPPEKTGGGGEPRSTTLTASVGTVDSQQVEVPVCNAAPTFDPNGAASQTNQDGSEYGAVSKEIRTHVGELVRLWGDSPSRKVLIVKELRKAKLVPKHFR